MRQDPIDLIGPIHCMSVSFSSFPLALAASTYSSLLRITINIKNCPEYYEGIRKKRIRLRKDGLERKGIT